jgi:hypothetical protein
MSPRRSKYGAIKTEVDGIVFASKAEARRYAELRLLEKAGEIRNLKLQPSFPIEVIRRWNGEVVQAGVYIADFQYDDVIATHRGGYEAWKTVIEDVKGMKTPVYRLKKKLVEAQYGIEITEVR